MTDTAEVKLGNVVLATPFWRWVFLVGAQSPEMRFVVDNEVDKALGKTKNPIALVCEVTRIDGRKKSNLNARKLYLRSRQRVDPWRTRWILRDERSEFENQLIGGRFNITRRANSLEQLSVSGGEGLRDQSQQVRQFRYVPTSLKEPGSDPPDFYEPKRELEENDGELWTALDIVKWCLTNALKGRDDLPTIDFEIEGTDNEYIQEDITLGPTGERFSSVLRKFMNLARVSLYVSDEGKWIVYDTADPPIPHKVGGYEGAGAVELEDLSRERPKKVITRFGAVHEVLLRFDDDKSFTAARNTSPEEILLQLDNVAVVPSTITVAGREFVRGTYATISDLLEAYNTLGWPSGENLTRERLRKWHLARGAPRIGLLFKSGTNFIDEEALIRWESLRNAYRINYRIPQALLDSITTWSPVRVTQIDPITGQRPPSPVWSDYAVVPTGKVQLRKGNNVASQVLATNVKFPGLDKLDESTTSPATVRIVDQDVGIFAIDYGQAGDLTGRISYFFPGRLVDPLTARARGLDGGGLLETTELEEDFEMALILSVRFGVPNGVGSLYDLKGDPADFGVQDAFGPPHEVAHTREPARWRWNTKQTRLDFNSDNQVEVLEAELVNESTLQEIAKGETQRVYWSYTDRYVGRWKRAEFDPKKDRPRGAMQSLIVEFKAGALQVQYVLPEGVPTPTLYELLPSSARQVVYREIERI